MEQYRPLVGALGLYTGDAALAEELAQEALARALLHWDRVGKARSPGAYVHRVAMNLANSHFRRRRAAGRALARHGPGEQVHRDPPVAEVLAAWGSCRGASARSWCCGTGQSCRLPRSLRCWA